MLKYLSKNTMKKDSLSTVTDVVSVLAIVMLAVLVLWSSCARKTDTNADTLRRVLRIICATACEAKGEEDCLCERYVADPKLFRE